MKKKLISNRPKIKSEKLESTNGQGQVYFASKVVAFQNLYYPAFTGDFLYNIGKLIRLMVETEVFETLCLSYPCWLGCYRQAVAATIFMNGFSNNILKVHPAEFI